MIVRHVKGGDEKGPAVQYEVHVIWRDFVYEF